MKLTRTKIVMCIDTNWIQALIQRDFTSNRNAKQTRLPTLRDQARYAGPLQVLDGWQRGSTLLRKSRISKRNFPLDDPYSID